MAFMRVQEYTAVQSWMCGVWSGIEGQSGAQRTALIASNLTSFVMIWHSDPTQVKQHLNWST